MPWSWTSCSAWTSGGGAGQGLQGVGGNQNHQHAGQGFQGVNWPGSVRFVSAFVVSPSSHPLPLPYPATSLTLLAAGCPALLPIPHRARVDSAELAEALSTMEALAAGRATWPPLAPPAAPTAFAAVPPAVACRPTLARASPVAIAAARSASLGSDEGSSLTATARLAVAAPCELSDEDEELRVCAASTAPAEPLPWVTPSAYAAAAAAAVAEAAAEDASQRTAPPRRCKKRCSMEAGDLAAVRALLVSREGEAAACRA